MMNRIEAGPGQESVWDYPRPPRLEATSKRIRVLFNGVTIADTTRAQRFLETSHPPTYYIPPADIQMQYLVQTGHHSLCEWKGKASYYTVEVGERRAENAAWFYPRPNPAYASVRDHVAFYAARMDACFVDEEQVRSQPGNFYGGWITDDIVGPFKGSAGIWGWW